MRCKRLITMTNIIAIDRLPNMCGRCKRRSDKQRIAEAFQVSVGLEELYLDPEEDDIAPQSFQPVIHLNEDGERQIELMRWAFKLPDRLLFNARSEGIEDANFWRESFIERRVSLLATRSLNGRTSRRARSRNMNSRSQAKSRLEWRRSGSSGSIRRQISGNGLSRSSLVNPMN